MAAKNPKPGSVAELAALYPAPKVIAVRVRSAPDAQTFEDDTIVVDEMDIVQIGRAAHELAAIPDLTSDNLLLIAARHHQEVFAAVGIAIRWPTERVSRLAARSFADVLSAIYEANDGFFIRCLALLGFAPQAMTAARAGAGERLLPTSAATAESSIQRH